MTKIGKVLRRRRLELKLTQSEVARRVGCSVPTISNVEAGERSPSVELLARWLEVIEARMLIVADEDIPGRRPDEDVADFLRVVEGLDGLGWATVMKLASMWQTLPVRERRLLASIIAHLEIEG